MVQSKWEGTKEQESGTAVFTYTDDTGETKSMNIELASFKQYYFIFAWATALAKDHTHQTKRKLVQLYQDL